MIYKYEYTHPQDAEAEALLKVGVEAGLFIDGGDGFVQLLLQPEATGDTPEDALVNEQARARFDGQRVRLTDEDGNVTEFVAENEDDEFVRVPEKVVA